MEEYQSTKAKIDICLEKLYVKDGELFIKNKGRGVCERCLVFRLAHYLQEEFLESKYFVDCDYNSSFARGLTQSGKPLRNPDGSFTKRFVDIIIHKRNSNDSDFICIEVKKWNNCEKKAVEKDIDNLKQLTSDYGYKYGFHIILGKNINSMKIINYNRT